MIIIVSIGSLDMVKKKGAMLITSQMTTAMALSSVMLQP